MDAYEASREARKAEVQKQASLELAGELAGGQAHMSRITRHVSRITCQKLHSGAFKIVGENSEISQDGRAPHQGRQQRWEGQGKDLAGRCRDV